MTKLRLFLIALAVVALIASHTFAYFWGYERGAHAEQTACQAAQIDQLNNLITGTAELTQQAGAASLALGKSINARKTADAKTTQEIRRALQATAPKRVTCVFDDGVMRIIEQAANAADQAATGGLNGDLPAGGETK
ncbi:hypothetical protein [Gilvimarinus agarilyticus]|uniref:hypothetical protein n=1 Tax=Gilvimarinus agarilyticus TaxID=679259 RepID=UPI0006974FDB|nr:hypothetical protein [Gilvimarinus agarilyticus]